jgi:hypothetical protein
MVPEFILIEVFFAQLVGIARTPLDY